MYEITYLGEDANYYHTMEIEADSKEEAKVKFLKETGKEAWKIYSIVEVED